MNKYQATLFANESDIYTALHSNKSKMSETALRKLAFKRGLIFPKSLEREDMVEKSAELPFSYSHITEIQKKLSTSTNYDTYSVRRIYDEHFTIDRLHDVLEKVKNGRPSLLGSESIEHFSHLNIYTVSIEYTEFDFRRNKFQQSKLYGGEIKFIAHSDFVSIQFNYTKRIQEILSQIIDVYRVQCQETLSVCEINLSAISDAVLRNSFAKHLYDHEGDYNSYGYTYAGLEQVRVSRIKTLLADEQSADESLLDAPDEEDGLDDDIEEDDTENLTFINNASYDGKSLVNTEQIENLCEEGFYQSKIKWKSRALFLQGNPIITFEFAFDDKYFAKDIKFKVLTKETAGSPETKMKLPDDELQSAIAMLEEKIFLINDYIIEQSSIAEVVLEAEVSVVEVPETVVTEADAPVVTEPELVDEGMS